MSDGKKAWAFVAHNKEANEDQVIAVPLAIGMTPLITTNEELKDAMLPMAKVFATKNDVTVRLLEFTFAREVTVLKGETTASNTLPPCPECGVEIPRDVMVALDHGGNIMGWMGQVKASKTVLVCASCSAFLARRDDGSLVKMTDEDLNELPDTARKIMLATRDHQLARRAKAH